MELNADRYKPIQLLKKQLPHGHAGYKLEFRITEFLEVNPRGKRKFLHVHVKVRRGKMELLEVKVPNMPLVIIYENHHFKKSERDDWKKIIQDNMWDIMIEIKTKLTEHGISLSEWEIEGY